MKSATVFFDCRGCGWSTGANNEEWAIDIIVERIRDHLTHDSRHLGLPRVSAEQQARDLLERMEVEGAQNFSAGELVELANIISASKLTHDSKHLGLPKGNWGKNE